MEYELSLSQLKQYADDIYRGTRINKRLSPAEEQGRTAGGRRHVEATLVACRENSANRANQSADERLQQENALMRYAKVEGIWYDDYDTRFGKKIGEGAEAIVYATDNERVIKANDLIFHETPLEFLDRIALHNYLFPEARYVVIGFTCRKDTGNFAVILQQPFVIAERGAVRAEVRAEMQKYTIGRVWRNPDSRRLGVRLYLAYTKRKPPLLP